MSSDIDRREDDALRDEQPQPEQREGELLHVERAGRGEGKKRPSPMARNLIIGGAVLVLALVGTLVAILAPPPSTPLPSRDLEELTVMAEKRDNLSRVIVSGSEGTLEFYLDTDAEPLQWRIKGYEELPLSASKIDDLLFVATNIVAGDVVRDSEDLSSYENFGIGADSPKMIVEFKDGRREELLLGNQSPLGNSYYLVKKGVDRVFMVYNSVALNFRKTASDFMELPAIAIGEDIGTYLLIERRDSPAIELEVISLGGGIPSWRLTQPYDREADTAKSEAIVNSASGLKLRYAIDGKPTDLSKYGLDEPRAKITVRDVDNNERQLIIGDEFDGWQVYCQVPGDEAIYSIDKDLVAFINTSERTLLSRRIALVMLNSIDRVVISGKGRSAEMTVKQTPAKNEDGSNKLNANGEQVYDETFFIDGKEVDGSKWRDVYMKFITLEFADELREDELPQGAADYTLEYFYKDRAQGSLKIEFVPYKLDYYLARGTEGNGHFYLLRDRIPALLDAAEGLLAQ